MSDASPHIAVVNDDSTFLSLMEDLLQTQEGYTVSTCREGDRGYMFVKDLQPDLIILDLIFQRAELGWKTLELLTLDPSTRQIPIILCTATEASIIAHEYWLRKFGIEVLLKPFDLDVLLDKVRSVLDRDPHPTTELE